METTFWTATLIYYTSLITAITVQPATIFVTIPLFFTIPGLTQVELVPGLKTSLEAQTEILKTQKYLKREGYYG